MNKNAIKNFAVSARITLIQAVTQKAFEYEVTENGKNDPSQAAVNGQSLTPAEQSQRAQLIAQIRAKGFASTMEEAAYTWFNRFIALRFMEVNNYLPSHTRIFSDEDGNFKPEVLTDVVNLEIDGLDKALILELLEQQKNEQLYQYIIITQCNALNEGLPEMFERIGGWTELLFPKNLLREDSVIAHMVKDIPEEDWNDQVQIIGWLYQYYNSEPKDRVFANLKKNIKISAADIPAATQLFTPDWIVRYMVENSLGRLWTEGHGKPENANWKYYLEEAEQEDAIKSKLEKLRAAYREIQPEQIKIIDPCMGSGHILVYAFDVLMDIYTACGWSERDAAKSILRNNLYGLDIDRRAYQLAYFAVMMKARQYNRRILTAENQPNLANFADVMHVDTSLLSGSLRKFAEQFQFADTYGSLMTVTKPAGLDEAVSAFLPTFGMQAEQLEMMMRVARILTQKYDVVCTNPPYMGGSGMNATLSTYVKKNFPDSKSDLFACFMEKCGQLIKRNGLYAMITQHAWMFLSSYEKLREKLKMHSIVDMAHLGARAFDEIGGEVVQTTAFVSCGRRVADFKGTYVRLVDIVGEWEKEAAYRSGNHRYTAKQENFSKIPGSPIAYWVSEKIFDLYINYPALGSIASPRKGNSTSNNDRFLRRWFEVNKQKMNLHCEKLTIETTLKKRWFPYNKGGGYRKWYGFNEYLIDWYNDAAEIRKIKTAVIANYQYFMKPGLTWSTLTSNNFSIRWFDEGFIFDNGGCCIFDLGNKRKYLCALLNSKVFAYIFSQLNPTLNFQSGEVAKFPIKYIKCEQVDDLAHENVQISKEEYDCFETSWDFERHPLV